MAPSQRRLYRNFAHYALNQVLLPAKLLVPQPVVGRIPGLTTNKEIRTGIVLQAVQGRLLDIENTAKLPFAEESFDTIAFVACINHIPNRVDVLREARRLLRPKGRVLITNLTPTLSRIWHGWAFWDADQHERGMKPGEVYGLTRRELIALVESTGFRFVRRVPFSWGLNSLYAFA
jgi:SAM-dependent methyltransferase